MRLRRTAFCFIAASTIHPIYAQDACTELAKAIVYNQSQSFTHEEQRQISKADLCSERYSKTGGSRSAQIDVAYKFFSGGASGSEQQIREEQDRQCDNKFGDYWSTKIESRSAKTASAEALDVVRECIRINSNGLVPRMTVADTTGEFTFSLTWNPTPANSLLLNHVGPRDLAAFQCKADVGIGANREFKLVKQSADERTTLQAGGSFVVTCNRPLDSKVVDGETMACYRETLVLVATNGPTATIKIPQSCYPSMPGERARKMEDQLKALQARIDALQVLNSTLQTQLSGISTDMAQVVRTGDFVRMFGRLPNTNECLHWVQGGNGATVVSGACGQPGAIWQIQIKK